MIKEFQQNELFSPILKRTSTGSGATGSGDTNPTTDVEKYFNPNNPEYSPTKQGEVQQSNPEIYNSLSNKHGLNDPFNVKTMAPKPNSFGHSTVFGS